MCLKSLSVQFSSGSLRQYLNQYPERCSKKYVRKVDTKQVYTA